MRKVPSATGCFLGNGPLNAIGIVVLINQCWCPAVSNLSSARRWIEQGENDPGRKVWICCVPFRHPAACCGPKRRGPRQGPDERLSPHSVAWALEQRQSPWCAQNRIWLEQTYRRRQQTIDDDEKVKKKRRWNKETAKQNKKNEREQTKNLAEMLCKLKDSASNIMAARSCRSLTGLMASISNGYECRLLWLPRRIPYP